MDSASALKNACFREDWVKQAACRDLTLAAKALFHPNKGEDAAWAKAICAGCEVRAECLDWALRNDERDGVWGGLTWRERRAVLNGADPLPLAVPLPRAICEGRPHGLLSTYNSGCRCGECRQVKAEAKRRERERNRLNGVVQ